MPCMSCSRFNCQTGNRGTCLLKRVRIDKAIINEFHSYLQMYVPNSDIFSLHTAAEERTSGRPQDSEYGIGGGWKLIGSQRTFTTEDLTGDKLK